MPPRPRARPGANPSVLPAAFLALAAAPAWAHDVSAAQKALVAGGGPGDYFHLGLVHMVTGLDHLLFLLGVVFYLTRFMDIVKLITAFTAGHTLTLYFASLLRLSADYHLVDAAIAVSVAYKGFENLDGFRRLGWKAPNLMGMVFAFGLVHGLGLSTRLQQVLPEGGLASRILAFNAGVEIGQVLALSVIFAGLLLARKAGMHAGLGKAANGFLVLAGFLLLLFQLHGYVHHAHAEDFHHHPAPGAEGERPVHDALDPLEE